jgi:hypothetical protein
MPAATLEEVIRLADHLAPLDQVRLIEHLVPRLAQVVAGTQPTVTAGPGNDADPWGEFLRIGEEIARRDRPEIGTLTSAVVSSRR